MTKKPLLGESRNHEESSQDLTDSSGNSEDKTSDVSKELLELFNFFTQKGRYMVYCNGTKCLVDQQKIHISNAN